MIFSINGRECPQLKILDYSVKLETLDGEGTGRAKATYWPMIRDPQGTIINLNLTFVATSSKNPDFVFVWQTCKSMGSTDFVRIRFVDPTGEILEQNMYIVAAELKYRRIEGDDRGYAVYTDALKVSLIAEKGA